MDWPTDSLPPGSVPVPVRPTPPPTLTVLPDGWKLPGEDDDLGPDRPAGALMVEPPFAGQKPTLNPAPNPLPAAPLLPPVSPDLPSASLDVGPQTAEAPATEPVSELSRNSPLPPISPVSPSLPSLGSLPVSPARPSLPVLVPLASSASSPLPHEEEKAEALEQSSAPAAADLSPLPVLPRVANEPTATPEPEPTPSPAAHESAPAPEATTPSLNQATQPVEDESEDLAFGCVPDATQLTLRALFGTSDWLTPQDVVNRCARLPGLRGCVLLRPDAPALSSDGLTEAEAGTFVDHAARTFKYLLDLAALSAKPAPPSSPPPADGTIVNAGSNSGTPHANALPVTNCTLRSDETVRSYFTAGNLCLAVWHQDAAFSAGTREKLILTAAELARLGDLKSQI